MVHIKQALARGYCHPQNATKVLDPYLLEAMAKELQPIDDLLDAAIGIISNAYGGDWSKATPEWRAAAERFRDDGYVKS